MKKIKKVLILGSGGLSIGQAGEFDFSGSQCLKALREEGIETILINPNIATIQTSKEMADKIYFLPITPCFVAKVIEKEKPDGILLSFGGQTALNCGISLEEKGILKKHNVQVLGTPVSAIVITEDKGLFVEALEKIDVKTPRSITISNVTDGIAAAKKIGFPLIIRAGFALGGLGSGFCNNEKELRELLNIALGHSTQVLVEESLQGWKEIEYEVVRDCFGNCMTVCNMENFDPLGIHTGESIVVAPSQTLTDREYHMLRSLSIKVIQHLGIIGECNIQYALDPYSEDYRVIEVNARLSRSSALASKATGYPLALIAAKLSLGKSLIDIQNPVTKRTSAFFEPALDYLVVKVPRWDTEKFRDAETKIGSSMKSVGEVMAIGRKFEEALQKAMRMVNPKFSGVTENMEFENLDNELRNPTHKRIFAISKALKKGYSIEKIHELTKIDKWFLHKLKNIIDIEKELEIQKKSGNEIKDIDAKLLRKAKQHGFSDRQISLLAMNNGSLEGEKKIRDLRKKKGIIPFTKQIDTLAGEYPCDTNYLYMTYNAVQDDIIIDEKNRGIIVLGSGPYSIGSSVEFDWCSVQCVKTIRSRNIPSVVINCNPETVSTDYDECDRLYFEELTYERVLDIYEKENKQRERALGMIVSMGGQIPNNLALKLSNSDVKILGTDAETIDMVEDRHKFSKILDELNVDQPGWIEASNFNEIQKFCSRVGYPVLIRPSYVLSGAAMRVVYDEENLREFIAKAVSISQDHPVVITKFITDAKEIDVDVVSKDGEVLAYAISEHIENAGVHSGDATLATPPQKLYVETMRRIKKITKQVINYLNITGPSNFQFLAKDNHIKIIECNLRASRSFPFVSKVYNVNFIELATRAMMPEIFGIKVSKIDTKAFDLDYVGVKAPQFSFTRLRGADPQLGVEMTSTGEVACIGENLQEAFLKSLLSTGFKLPVKNILLSTGDVKQKTKLLDSIKLLHDKGMNLYATQGTAEFYRSSGIKINILNWPLENIKPNVLDFIREKKLDLIINIPKSNEPKELTNDYHIRRAAADFSIPLITNPECAKLFVESICNYSEDDLEVKSWNEYIEE